MEDTSHDDGPAGLEDLRESSAEFEDEHGHGSDDDEFLAQGGLDPVSSWLLKLLLALVVVLLATTVALVIFLVTLREAPRTVAERNIGAAEMAVKEHPEKAASWSELAAAYAAAGRYEDALAIARKGREATRQDILLITEADVLRLAGRYEEAVNAYNLADSAVSKAETEAAVAQRKKGIYVPAPASSYALVFLGRGLAEQKLGDLTAATADLERASARAPLSASVLVALGDLYAEAGSTAKAIAAYETALRFVPDLPEAIAGLDKLKKGN